MVQTNITVAKVAKLANLDLTEAEIDKFTPQLDAIFGYIDQLAEVDTKDVPPTAQVTGLENVSRPDEVAEKRILSQTEAVGQSVKTEKHLFVVKAVFDND